MRKKWIAVVAATCIVCAGVIAFAGRNSPSPADADTINTGEMVFVGWNTEANGSGTSYMPGDTAPRGKDLDLYAQWAKKYNDFSYTGKVQTFTAPVAGNYRIEVWGAQGGAGGNGGYSYGNMQLTKNQKLYVSVGGSPSGTINGGWNGGGNGGAGYTGYRAGWGGGGATSIQLSLVGDGQLKNYASVKDSQVVIVAGGGGGSGYFGTAGAGGGTSGQSVTSYGNVSTAGANQTSGYQFGQGQTAAAKSIFGAFGAEGNGGGGGGWYGGRALNQSGANSCSHGSGGSGHIGTMMSYGTTIAGNENTLDRNGNSVKGNSGNGYARITLVSADTNK